MGWSSKPTREQLKAELQDARSANAAKQALSCPDCPECQGEIRKTAAAESRAALRYISGGSADVPWWRR